jgi:hypothetical protein
VFQAEDKMRKQYLEDYKKRLLTLETTAPIKYHKLYDYDENMSLKKV